MDIGEVILILSFLTPVVVIVMIFMWIRSSNSKLAGWAKENKARQARAKPANAKIISAKQGVTGGDIKRIVYLELDILDSIKPYRASAAWFVDTLHFSKIQEGNVISVKVDADNPMKIYPADSWAVYTEGYDTPELKKLSEP
jgi:hypothetical protein